MNKKDINIFYEKNAKSFSDTRNFPWPSTKKFLDSLKKDSKIIDIGCGNGRNMFYRSDINITGLELSRELCNIVESKGGVVVNSNMTTLPFEDMYFDSLICVSAYHHLDNISDRMKAIQEMVRVLRINSLGFIQVWAMEQPYYTKRKFIKRDELVTWKNNDGVILNRYYRIYSKGELEEEIYSFLDKSKIEIINTIYEEGNWIVIFKKLK